MAEDGQAPQGLSGRRQDYEAPRLLPFGRLTELTAGGSGSKTEAAQGNKGKSFRL